MAAQTWWTPQRLARLCWLLTAEDMTCAQAAAKLTAENDREVTLKSVYGVLPKLGLTLRRGPRGPWKHKGEGQ